MTLNDEMELAVKTARWFEGIKRREEEGIRSLVQEHLKLLIPFGFPAVEAAIRLSRSQKMADKLYEQDCQPADAAALSSLWREARAEMWRNLYVTARKHRLGPILKMGFYRAFDQTEKALAGKAPSGLVQTETALFAAANAAYSVVEGCLALCGDTKPILPNPLAPIFSCWQLGCWPIGFVGKKEEFFVFTGQYNPWRREGMSLKQFRDMKIIEE